MIQEDKANHNTILSTLKSEEKNDSLQFESWIATASEYLSKGTLQDAELNATNALNLAKAMGNQQAIAKSYFLLAQIYREGQQFWKIIDLFDSALRLFQSNQEWEKYWEIRIRKGMVYYEMGDYQNALDILFETLKYYETEHKPQWVSTIYNNIGIIFQRGENDLEKSVNYYQKAFDELEKEEMPDDKLLIMILTNMGLAKFGMGLYREAENYFLQSLDLNQKFSDTHVQIVNYGNLGLVYSELFEFERSEEYFQKAIALSLDTKKKFSLAVNTADLGRLYIRKAESAKDIRKRNQLIHQAISNYQNALSTFLELKDFRRFGGYSKDLSQAYEMLGNYTKALEAYKTYSYYNDSLFNDETSKEFSRLEIRHEYRKKEDSLQLENEKRIAVKDATVRAHQKQKQMLLVGTLLLIIIGLLLFYQNLNRKRTNAKLSKLNNELNDANQIKVKFLSILNHDLRSPISNIIKFMRNQQHSLEEMDMETKFRLQNQILNGTENLLASMDDMLLWCKGQMENFEPQFKPVSVESIFEELKGLVSDMSVVHISYNNPENLIITTDENFLKTIIRNLTYNAVKALDQVENPEIIWETYTSDGSQILSIKDNGMGSNSEQFRALYDERYTVGIKTGLGLHLIRDMAKAINCKVQVSSTPNVGTNIQLIFSRSKN